MRSAMADAVAIAAAVIPALALVATLFLAVFTHLAQRRGRARVEALAARVRKEEQQTRWRSGRSSGCRRLCSGVQRLERRPCRR